MHVALEGSSSAALTAGILLLSRARSFGFPIKVDVVGDPAEISPVVGPALLHSPVIASCGIGRELGSGALVIVPGPATEPLAVCLDEGGVGEWFLADRAGSGCHEHTVRFVSLCRESRPGLRELGRQLRRAFQALGCAPEPAVLDLLFAAPVPPLLRLGLALRAGRAMSGAPGETLSRYLQAGSRYVLPEPLPEGCGEAEWEEALASGLVQQHLERFGLVAQDRLERWLDDMRREDPQGHYLPLVVALGEVISQVLSLPDGSMMVPLPPAQDAVAVGLGAAIGATRGDHDASQRLVEMFRFLGGRFVDSSRFPVRLESTPPPKGRLERWAWFAGETRRAAETADSLWRRVVDPDQ